MVLRQDRLDGMDVEKLKPKRALVPRLADFVTKDPSLKVQDAFDRVVVDSGAGGVNDVLARMAVSNFDELEERRRLIKYDQLWERAEKAYAASKKSAVLPTT